MKPAGASSNSKSSVAAPAAARRTNLWPGLFAVSLLGNAALAWLVWQATQRPASHPVTTTPVATAPAASIPGAGKPAGDLGAYAALGSFVAENNRIPDLHWNEAQFQAFENGMRASFEGRGYALDEDGRKLRDEISVKVQAMLAADRPDPVQEYFKTLREKENVQRTPSGLHYRITDEGSGKTPSANSTVLMSFSAKLPSGESLPALSRTRVKTKVSDLLPGLREGIQLFKVGTKGLIYLPPELSFGNGEWPQEVPKGAPIVFFVELHEVD